MSRLLAAAALLSLAPLALAADDAQLAKVREKMHKLFGVAPEEVQPSAAPGLYEINHHHDFGYVTADGKYLLHGDLVSIDTGAQITEQHRRADRLAAIQALGVDNLIRFPPPPPMKTKYVVTVFTDVDCGYCRKLHSELPQLNARGIEIRYAFWPRSGPDTPSWYRAEAVWCASDRQAMLTRAKLGEDIPIPPHLCANPVEKEYQLGVDLGIHGTPSLLLPDGELLDGLVPVDWLAQHLAEADAAGAISGTRAN